MSKKYFLPKFFKMYLQVIEGYTCKSFKSMPDEKSKSEKVI